MSTRPLSRYSSSVRAPARLLLTRLGDFVGNHWREPIELEYDIDGIFHKNIEVLAAATVAFKFIVDEQWLAVHEADFADDYRGELVFDVKDRAYNTICCVGRARVFASYAARELRWGAIHKPRESYNVLTSSGSPILAAEPVPLPQQVLNVLENKRFEQEVRSSKQFGFPQSLGDDILTISKRAPVNACKKYAETRPSLTSQVSYNSQGVLCA